MTEDIVRIRAKTQRFEKYKTLLLAEEHGLQKTLRRLLDESANVATVLRETQSRKELSLAYIARQTTAGQVDCLHIESAWHYVGVVQVELVKLEKRETEIQVALEKQRQALAQHKSRIDKTDSELKELAQSHQRWYQDREAMMIEDNFVACRTGEYYGR